MATTDTTEPAASWRDRLIRLSRDPQTWVLLGPLLIYASLIRVKHTFGDGPELLVAAYKLGGSHPSGYPLFTLLGYVPAHFPFVSPFWNVAFVLSAIPTAVAGWAIYRTARELSAGTFAASIAGLAWSANWHVVYQATRIEVYGLHCMFLALALWASVRFARLAREGEDDSALRWIYLAVLFTCLGLTNHLTSVFLVAPVTIGMLIAAPRLVLRPRPIATMFAISAACAAVYAYLPLQAMANAGDRISWNNPQTWESFWFHVTGAEYTIFRRYDQIVPTLVKFYNSLGTTFFPGVLLVAALGVYEWVHRGWRSLLVVLVFQASSLAYMSTYPIRDVSTYYTALYVVVMMAFALGLDWFLSAREARPEGALNRWLFTGVLLACLAWVAGSFWVARENGWRETFGEDLGRQTATSLQEPAIVFTSVDGHTFPMWYQIYVAQPDRQVAVIDTVMFNLNNKQWYRDALRSAYPWIEWPSDEVATGGGWRQWIVDKNPQINHYALLHSPWPESRSYPVVRGWHHEIERGRPQANEKSKRFRHVYVSLHETINGHNYLYDSRRRYRVGEGRIACVGDWWDHGSFNASWVFEGPGGKRVEFSSHHVPKDSGNSWEFLEPADQVAGPWTCTITAPGEPPAVVEFELE